MDEIKLKNALDVYDLFVVQELKKKFPSVDIDNRWVYIPADLSLSYASEKFGQKLFPMYSVFRSTPPVKNVAGSLAAFRNAYNLSPDKSIYQLLVDLTYHIEFWSRSMFDMNQSVMDWYRFEKDATLSFDFSKIGLPELNEKMPTILTMESPADNSSISDIYNIGRYYRYTYSFTMTCLIFDVICEIPLKEIVLGLYDMTPDEVNKLFEETIEVPNVG
jgi:hypothetical protein